MTLFVPVPTSKSMTQRALLIAALGAERTTVRRPLDCDDSRYLVAALAKLGATVATAADTITVDPAPLPLRPPPEALFCGNAGTAVRFLAPLALLADGTLTIDGDEHMRKRPLGALADSLRALGVDARYAAADGCPPVALTRARPAPPQVAVDMSLSSQYASGLLLAAPALANGLEVELTGTAVSRPYLDMTVAMMRGAGARVAWAGERTLRVEPGRYRGGEIAVEVDWSAAAFVLAAARITGRDVRPDGLGPRVESLQGDAVAAALFGAFDAHDVNEFDLTDCPDLIAPLAAAALFAAKPTRIRGAAHTRVKECDRLAVLAREFAKLGATLREYPDGLDLSPLGSHPAGEVALDPDGDHRMAMAFGLVSLRIPGLRVLTPECVSKSFPDFWPVLARIRQHVSSP